MRIKAKLLNYVQFVIKVNVIIASSSVHTLIYWQYSRCVLNVHTSVHLQRNLTFILPVLNLTRNSILSLHFLCPVFACILLVFKLDVNNLIILTGYLENLLKYLHNPTFPINIVIS